MFAKLRLPVLCAALAASACDAPADPDVEYAPPPESGALAAGLDLPAPIRSGLLPAYETEAERAVKDDSIDYRGSYQEIYGYTDAPRAARAVAEFEPTDGVVLAWEGELSPFFLDVADAIVDSGTTLYVVTYDLNYTAQLKDYLRRNGVDTAGVVFLEYDHEAFWARDYGPWTVETGAGDPAWVDPRYYPERRRDDAIPTLLGTYLDVDVYRPNLNVEGGNFMTNSDGFCAATEWIVQQNPYLSQRQVEDTLRRYMGCEQVLIVERLYGEGTGHIDMFAKFTSPDTVLVGEYDARVDSTNAAILDRNAERFAQAGFRVVRIPMPKGDWQAYRSYTNSLIVNDTVIVPTYDTDRRLEAAMLDAYRKAMPAGYRIVTVDASEIIYYGGAIHCVTMQFNRSPIGTRPPAPNFTSNTPEVEPEVEEAEVIEASNDASFPIQDLRRTLSPIEIDAARVAGEIEVAVSIRHTYIGDLLVYLEHDGKRAVLHEFAGAGADDIQRRFTTRTFEGAATDGLWELVIEDHAEQDEGRLEGWSLTIR